MRRLSVFNQVSLDGYYCDLGNDMSWARQQDAEWMAFTNENASGDAEFVFGRVTYEMMAGWWPSPMAAASMPLVAERMNATPKVVFSRTLERASWSNTRLFKGELTTEVRRLKADPGPGMLIMGSGSLVGPLAEQGLIDEYQIVVIPIVLGGGRSMFAGLTHRMALRRTSARTFENGSVVLRYEPVG